MRFEIRHQFRTIGNYYVTTFFNDFYKALIKKYPKHDFDNINYTEYESNGYGSIYSCMNFSIVNPETQKYILISFFDNWKYHFMKHLGWQPSNMVNFFYPGGFNYIDYYNYIIQQKNNSDIECPRNISTIYKPFFYGTYNDGYAKDFTTIYKKRKLKSTIPKLYFRGQLWDFRKDMVQKLKKFPSLEIIDKSNKSGYLDYPEYLNDLAQYRCALSLPGGTEICNRDIECFGLGVPVIRPYLDIHYPDPLISNYHYINCYSDCKYWDGNPSYLSYKDVQAHILKYWLLIKDNFEYLDFVAKNARSWYVKNCSINSNIKYILSNMELEKL